MINISKFLMLAALCNAIISANNEENSEMIICPQANNIVYILPQGECENVVKLINHKLIHFIDKEEAKQNIKHITENNADFMEYIKNCNANQTTTAFFNIKKDQIIENNDNKNQ